jgi:hypothetical protein
MFIGHFAVGFGAKRAAPRSSLAALLTAALFLDVIWPFFVWAGLERVRIAPGDTRFTPLAFDSFPWSHSLLLALGWSAAVAVAYHRVTRYRAGAVWMGLAVFSHWLLDLASHRPDLQVAPGLGLRVGLGLWNSVPGTAVTEVALFVAGLALYLSATRARSAWGHVSLWGLVLVLAFLYAGAVQGTPPPSLTALKIVSTSMVAFIAWFAWIDRTRRPRHP